MNENASAVNPELTSSTHDAIASTEGESAEGALDATGEGTHEEPEQEPGSRGRFGGMSPAEAGRRRWQKQREQEAALATAGLHDTDDATFVRVPIRKGTIIRKLEQDAAKGSVQAARELRSWLSEYPPEEVALDVGAIPKEVRHKLYARILAELQEAGETDLPALAHV